MSTVAPPVHASVAFLRIPGFDSLPVSEQASRKERLVQGARGALAHVPTGERLVLDAPDGLAVVLFGDVPRALDAAAALHGAAAPLQSGLNHGPLALAAAASDARVIGDGIEEAASAARFAAPGQLFATEAFARALQAVAPDRGVELVRAGEFTDTNVRVHTFFAPDPQRRAARLRRLAIFAAGGSILILLLGVVGRDLYQPLLRVRPAMVTLDVKPRGEVFVDDNPVGRIPPLTRIEVPPGRHKLTIRNPGSRPYEVNFEVAAGQRITFAHTFVAQPPPKADFWRDMRKRFGS